MADPLDDDAFMRQLMQKYERYALKLVSSDVPREERFDVVQEAWMRTWSSVRNGSRPKYPAQWLQTVIRNLCIDRARKRNVSLCSIEEENDERDTGPFAIPDLDPLVNPPEVLMEQEGIWENLQLLPAGRVRNCVHLHDICGYSISQTAQQLGIPEGTVSPSVSKGRKQLRPVLLVKYEREVQ